MCFLGPLHTLRGARESHHLLTHVGRCDVGQRGRALQSEEVTRYFDWAQNVDDLPAGVP